MSAKDHEQLKSKRISKTIFQSMVESAHESIFVYQGDHFYYANKAFERMLGYSAEELEGMGFKEVLHEKSATLITQRHEAMIRGEKVSPRSLDVIFKTKGSKEKIISLSTSPIALARGGPATLNIAHDISRSKGMEQSLESTNKFLSGLIASSSDAIIVFDSKGNALIFNKAAEEITGYSAKDMLNRKINMAQLMIAGERDRIMAILDKGTEQNPKWVVSEETFIQHRDTALIPISASVSYLYAESKPVAAISVFRDLRPLKKVEKKLRESEEKYRMLVEKTQDGIFVYQNNRFKYVNPAFRELLGYSDDEIMQLSLTDIVRPELASMIVARYNKMKGADKTPEQYEIALCSKDGHWRAFEITPTIIEYECEPATQNVIRDITRKREAQKALKASEARYRATFEHAGTAMVVLDDDYTIAFANHQMENISGYTKDEIEGKVLWTDVVHTDDVERMKGYHLARREIDKEVPSQYEFRFIDKSGKTRECFLTIGMIPGTRQSVVAIMDISAIKQLQHELEQAKKMAILGEMSAHVAHEVRNPLQKIKTGVEQLSNTLPLDDRQRRQFDGVKQGMDNLEKFVTQILEWTRSGELKRRSYHISNIIDGLLFNLNYTLTQKGVDVQTSYSKDADTAVVDGIQLRQVFDNIIENALDAMTEGGILKIATRLVDKYTFYRDKDSFACEAFEISFKDSGCGIAPDDFDRIFQPFFTKKTKGTGLGLALVKKVIDMHGGEVSVKSNIDEGAEFIIRLPRHGALSETKKNK